MLNIAILEKFDVSIWSEISISFKQLLNVKNKHLLGNGNLRTSSIVWPSLTEKTKKEKHQYQNRYSCPETEHFLPVFQQNSFDQPIIGSPGRK